VDSINHGSTTRQWLTSGSLGAVEWQVAGAAGTVGATALMLAVTEHDQPRPYDEAMADLRLAECCRQLKKKNKK